MSVLGLGLGPVLKGCGQLGGDLQALPGGSHEVQLGGQLLVVHVLHFGLAVKGPGQLSDVLETGADVTVNANSKSRESVISTVHAVTNNSMLEFENFFVKVAMIKEGHHVTLAICSHR